MTIKLELQKLTQRYHERNNKVLHTKFESFLKTWEQEARKNAEAGYNSIYIFKLEGDDFQEGIMGTDPSDLIGVGSMVFDYFTEYNLSPIIESACGGYRIKITWKE